MPIFQLFLLALIQGITEFLPVSSSAHLILLPKLADLQDQGLVIDVAVHVGTLAAVCLYFRADVGRAFQGALDCLRGRFGTARARLFLLLCLATVPVVIAGLAVKLTGLNDAMRSVQVIAWAMIVFGIVLWWADRRWPDDRTADGWTVRDAVVMGLWQAVALIPGTSRSGATITASRFLGFDRAEGARLAMLMSIPTIIASGVLLLGDAVAAADTAALRDAAIAAVMSGFAAFAALGLMMRLLRSVSFTPYVIYRLGLGTLLLWLVATGRLTA